MKGRGRAAGRKTAATTKKRGAAAAGKKAQAGQKLITDSFNTKATTGGSTTETSPEKKVRRMRPSPFNKKSGSVLDRMNLGQSSSPDSIEDIEDSDLGSGLGSIDEGGSGESGGVMPARPRPQRANKKQLTYVLSDSDNEDDDDDASDAEVDVISDDEDSDDFDD